MPDSILRCLADQHRRYILAYLRDADDGSATFDELVDHVVEQETHFPSPDRESVAVALYHRHLPKLADAGLVDYERERDTITTTDRTKQTERLLESGPSEDSPKETTE